jgi:hypothetical protein
MIVFKQYKSNKCCSIEMLLSCVYFKSVPKDCNQRAPGVSSSCADQPWDGDELAKRFVEDGADENRRHLQYDPEKYPRQGAQACVLRWVC